MGGFQIQCGHNGSNIQRMKIDQTEVVFNESSLDSDFRVETDGGTATFFVDGGENSAAVGTSNLSNGLQDSKFTVSGIKDGTFGRTCLFLRDTDPTVGGGNTMMVCAFTGDGNASGGTYIAFRDSGNEIGAIDVASTSSVSFSTTSDYRLKENVKPMSDVWDKIKFLNL